MILEQRISEIFRDCLLRKDEIRKGKPLCEMLKAHPITSSFEQFRIAFNAERIKKYAPEINDLLDQLPDKFHEGSGGGLPFQQSLYTRDGIQWTVQEGFAEELLLLGMALGRVAFRLARGPHDSVLSTDGNPYIVIFQPALTQSESQDL